MGIRLNCLKIYCDSREIADRVSLADTFFTRFKGLMGKKSLAAGEGLLLLDCPSIHCFFMKMPIDAVYLSGDMTVLGIETLSPWKLGRHVKNTVHVLELGACTAFVSTGDKLEIYDEHQERICHERNRQQSRHRGDTAQ